MEKRQDRNDRCLHCEYLQKLSAETGYCPFFSCIMDTGPRQAARRCEPGGPPTSCSP